MGLLHLHKAQSLSEEFHLLNVKQDRKKTLKLKAFTEDVVFNTSDL